MALAFFSPELPPSSPLAPAGTPPPAILGTRGCHIRTRGPAPPAARCPTAPRGRFMWLVPANKQTQLKQISRLSILIKNFCITPNLIFKNEVKERFDENMHYTEDHDLLLRIAERYQVYKLVGAGIPTDLGRRPMTAGGLSGNRFLMRLGELYMYKKFLMKNLASFSYFPLVTLIIFSKLILEMLRFIYK